jgi:hypothetical protein
LYAYLANPAGGAVRVNGALDAVAESLHRFSLTLNVADLYSEISNKAVKLQIKCSK